MDGELQLRMAKKIAQLTKVLAAAAVPHAPLCWAPTLR
jgi:hypothetical protein